MRFARNLRDSIGATKILQMCHTYVMVGFRDLHEGAGGRMTTGGKHE